DRPESGHIAGRHGAQQQVFRSPQARLASKFGRGSEVDGAGNLFRIQNTSFVHGPVCVRTVGIAFFHGCLLSKTVAAAHSSRLSTRSPRLVMRVAGRGPV